MEKNVLWAKSYLPPSTHVMLFVRKGLPTSRPTLHRGEGGSERILQQFGKKALCPTHFGQDCSYTQTQPAQVMFTFSLYLFSNVLVCFTSFSTSFRASSRPCSSDLRSLSFWSLDDLTCRRGRRHSGDIPLDMQDIVFSHGVPLPWSTSTWQSRGW